MQSEKLYEFEAGDSQIWVESFDEKEVSIFVSNAPMEHGCRFISLSEEQWKELVDKVNKKLGINV